MALLVEIVGVYLGLLTGTGICVKWQLSRGSPPENSRRKGVAGVGGDV